MPIDDEETEFSIQKRLDSIRKILNPCGEIPAYVLKPLELNYRDGDLDRDYSIEDDEHVLVWSERGKVYRRKSHRNQNEVEYSIVVEALGRMSSHWSQSKHKGRVTEDMIKEVYEYRCGLMDTIDALWSKTFRAESEKQLASILEERRKNREKSDFSKLNSPGFIEE